MSLPPLATIGQLEQWLGRTIDDATSVARAEAILAAASTLVRTQTGRVWVDAGDEPEDVPPVKMQAVQQVVVQVAARVYTNPNGITQETTGPFSRSVSAWAALGLTLTQAERSMIGGTTGSGIPGLSSARVVAPAAARGTHRPFDWSDWDPDAIP